MDKNTVFSRTGKGEAMLNESTADELPSEQRGVLALVNGRRSVGLIIERLIAQKNVEQLLGKLLERQLITEGVEQVASSTPAKKAADSGRFEKAQQLMVNTLRTFAGSFRNAKLLQAIAGATTVEELRDHVDPWYQALTDNPEGAVRADDFRAELLKMLL